MAATPDGSRNFGSGLASDKDREHTARAGRRLFFGEFEARPEAGLLLRNGSRVRIQDLPLRMLLVLLDSPGEIVTREELRNRLWGEQTFVEFDNNLRVAAAKLREALRDNASQPLYLETIARRGYRFLASVECITTAELPSKTSETIAVISSVSLPEAHPIPLPDSEPEYEELALLAPQVLPSRRASSIRAIRLPLAISIAAALIAASVLGWMAWRRRTSPLIADTEKVALGRVWNQTGDASLDDSLTLPFRIKMEESPHLHVLSPEKFERASQAAHSGESQSPSVANELAACAASGATFLLNGRLLPSGSGYRVRFAATRCSDGRETATTTADASNRDALLGALDEAANAIRLRAGETPAMLDRFNVPVSQATTSSLAALQAFRIGEQKHFAGRDQSSREDYKLAIDLDPNFALAYVQLGRSYSNIGERELSSHYFQKAFDLRGRTTDREKLLIASAYYGRVTGETDHAIEAFKLWSSLYPLDVVPLNNIATEYYSLGDGAKAVAAVRRAIELDPTLPVPYATLAQSLLAIGDQRSLALLCNDKQRMQTDVPGFHLTCYKLALVQGDRARQQAEERWAEGTALEGPLLNEEAEAEAYAGHLHHAADLFHKAADDSNTHGEHEMASVVELNGVGVLWQLGYTANAEAHIEDARAHAEPGSVVDGALAVTWSLIGDTARARQVAKQSQSLWPLDTLLNEAELPAAYALMALHEGHARAAVDILEPARPYDLNTSMELMPIYLRGQTLLAAGDPRGAMAEFERLLAHSMQSPRSVCIPLSRLALVKLYADEGEKDKARAQARILEEMWSTADPGFAPLHELRTMESSDLASR
jgi:eukaryotic-like serine/threonine-protein kinase